jgi:hypothetical protein
METLIVLAIGAALILGCVALGFGLLVIDPTASKATQPQKSNAARRA